MPQATAFDIASALEQRKAFQESRGRSFRVRSPRPLPPIPVERKYTRNIQRFFRDTLIEKTNQLLIEQLDSLVAEGRRDLGIELAVFDAVVVKADSFASRLQQIINGILIDYGLDLEKFKRTIAARGIDTSDFNKKQIQKIYKQALGVDVFLREPYLIDTIQSFVDINTSFLRRYGDEYADRIGDTVLNGVRQGLATPAIAKLIRDQYSWLTKNKAQLLARDQVGKLDGQLSMVRHGQLGVERYTWRTALDERVRAEHQAMEGKIYTWVGKEASPIGPPGFPIQCRCVAEPILEDIIDNL